MKQNNSFQEITRLFARVKEVSREKGIYDVLLLGMRKVANWLKSSFGCAYYKRFKSNRIFVFQEKSYKYFYHRYNFAWRNERAVEIPIVWEIINEYRGKKILEVGDVLSHYFSITHEILDKYDKSAGLINQDVCDFQPRGKYDLIVSISTLEHVGWDEEPREPMKILRAMENLKSLLAAKGKIIATLPLGYNPIVDRLLQEGKVQFTKMYCLKRISRDNQWMETPFQGVNNARYAYPFNNANGLVIGVMEKGEYRIFRHNSQQDGY